MQVRIVEITGTKIVDGDIVAEALVLGDDSVEDTVFTLPGFQSRPVDGSKFALIETASGDMYFFGLPNEGAVEKGEARMFWTNSSGVLKGEIYGQADGKLTIMAKGNTDIDVTGNTNIKASGTTTVEATGLLTIKSAQQVTVDAPKIALRGATAEVIADLFTAFTALSTATAGGFPLTCAAAMVTEVAQLASVKE